MKKLLFFLCLILGIVIFYGCNKDLKNDVDDLKKTTIVDVYFEGENLMVVYSNGTTETVALPDYLSATLVQSINFDAETGDLNVTFNDGSTSVFEIIDHDMEKYLAQDVDGKYYVKDIKLGDVSLADFKYDAQNNLVEIATRYLIDNEVTDVAKVVKTYTGNVNTGYSMYLYSFGKDVDSETDNVYDYEYLSFDHSLSAEEILSANGDGTYTYYIFDYSSGSDHYYDSYSPCVWVPESEFDATDGYYYSKISDNEFCLIPSDATKLSTKTVGGVDSVLVAAELKETINSVVEKGEIYDTINAEIQYNAAGLAEKIIVEPDESYILNTYNANNMLIKNEYFNWDDVASEWVKDDMYITHTYNSDNLIVSSTMYYTEDTVEKTREIYKVTYDDQKNPVTISLYQEEDIDWEYVNGENGGYTFKPVVVREAGYLDLVKIEYNYNMKNFWGNTWNSLIPELKGIQMNNAPKKILYANHFSYADMEYSNFNEGGYPKSVKAKAKIYDIGDEAYFGFIDFSAELIIDYLKLE